MVNVIEVTADEMPSRLLGTAIEKFEMAEFRGKDIVALSKATSDTTLTTRTEIFYSVISNCIEDQDVVDNLTVNDVWYLALLQWKRTQRNMMIKAPCKAPVYSLAGPNQRVVYSASDIDAESGDEVASVDPCNGEASSFITFDDVKVVRCDKEVFVKKPNEFVHLLTPISWTVSLTLRTRLLIFGCGSMTLMTVLCQKWQKLAVGFRQCSTAL